MDLGSADSGSGDEAEEIDFLETIPRIFITLGLLFPWMNREYVLWKMTFPELMMYYVTGTQEHLKLSGLYVSPDKPKESSAVINEGMNHDQIYEYYHNLQYDESTFQDLM